MIIDFVTIFPGNITLKERTRGGETGEIEIDSGERQEGLQLFMN